MKAVIVKNAGATPEVGTDIEIPEPNDTQILIKCIYTAVNPVDAFMAGMGMLVDSWPLIPGCDAAGVVVKAGKDAESALGVKLKEGDEVFGCTRLGQREYAAWQEYLLLDAIVTIPKPKNLNFAQASATGSGVLTAFDGVFHASKIPLLDPENLPKSKNEWVLVFGGASTVGKFAVQALKLCGYKVITTCSAKSFELLGKVGADATVDYSKQTDDLIAEIQRITNNTLNLAFDAVAQNNDILIKLYASLPATSTSRLYVSTNDWDPLPDKSHGFVSVGLQIGPIGRPESTELNARLNKYIPVLYTLLESGKIQAGEYAVKGEGIEGIPGAWEYFKGGKAGSTKVVIKVAEV